MNTDESFFTAPDSGQRVGPGITWKVASRDLHGSVSMFEGVLPPGITVPPHVHSNEDECTRVLDGELVFRVGDREMTATAGAYVVKPRGVPHAFWNPTSRPARVLEIVAPGTLDVYFRDFAALSGRVDLTETDRASAMDALQARFGIRTDWDAARALFERLGRR
jgi:quercetin dioxygenase-like cupin family protein